MRQSYGNKKNGPKIAKQKLSSHMVFCLLWLLIKFQFFTFCRRIIGCFDNCVGNLPLHGRKISFSGIFSNFRFLLSFYKEYFEEKKFYSVRQDNKFLTIFCFIRELLDTTYSLKRIRRKKQSDLTIIVSVSHMYSTTELGTTHPFCFLFVCSLKGLSAEN